MAICFVIQPFDKGKFDKRFQDVFLPAIAGAGLEAYRVDRDPAASIPIDEIQAGIRTSEACLADITTDNPNVWFELGYAIASQREVVLVCSDERDSKFPFDVQHRAIIQYSTDSPSDFETLQQKIESQLVAKLKRRDQLGQVARVQSVAKMEGLDQHQVAVLISVAEQMDRPGEPVDVFAIRHAMEYAGFTKIATTLGLRSLLDNGMLDTTTEEYEDGPSFVAYRVTDSGMAWLIENKDKLTLTRQKPPESGGEEIPF